MTAPNYGTPIEDEATGLKFIIDHASGKKLYLWPECRICGIARYSFSSVIEDRCRAHEGVESNDNLGAMEMFQ